MLFEYELPLNVAFEKLTANFTSLGCLGDAEFIGFHFESDADCTLFSTMLTDLAERLVTNSTGILALGQVAKMNSKKHEMAEKKLCSSIDIEVLLSGTGSK